jgi:hypothetical protein
MDWANPQVISFAATLAALDDDALAALANKGLVRRARKDLKKAPPKFIAADERSVTLELEGFTVRLTQPANRSTCTCSAGVCRHVLAGFIFIRERIASADAPPSIEPPTGEPKTSTVADELLAIDEAALASWAGKPLVRRAAIALARGSEIDETPAAVIVRLPAQNITVRWVGGGLDAMICSCHAPGGCEHKVAAVLAFRAHRSGQPVALPEAILQASAGAPRSRDEVRQSVQTLLEEMIALGLSRVSSATEQRLRTLAISAHGVDLPRLERMLRGLADEVSLALKRDAAASSGSLLSTAARISALCAALARPTHGIVGEHRSLYLPVAGSVELVGLGARRWRTRSGYHGLSVFFWEPGAKRWTGWTDARPLGTPGFDPFARFGEAGPWSGASSPRHAAQTTWRISGAHRNSAGRLASRDNTRGIAGSRSSPSDGPLISDFAQLAAIAEQAFAPGLTERRDNADLVLLAPAAWLEAQYDAVQQEVTRPIVDPGGRIIPLLLRHSPETDAGLTTLQRTDASQLRAVLGSLRIGARGLFVEPISLWTDGKPIHLTLDGAPISMSQAAVVPASQADEELEEPDEEAETAELDAASGLGRLLAHIDAELLAIAEAGVSVIRDVAPLRRAASELLNAGIASCGEALRRLCDELDRRRKSTDGDASSPAAAALLRCAHLTRLARESQTIWEAVGA